MNSQFSFFTDIATLAFFDPERLATRTDADIDWWFSEMLTVDELQPGAFAHVSLGADGDYRVRITDGELTVDERDYAKSELSGLGVEVVSGKLFAGPGEFIPGGGSQFAPADVQRGLLLEMENGPYEIDLFAISWQDSPRWWRDDDAVPDDAPPDVVARLRPRLPPFGGIGSYPQLDFFTDGYLYESTTRSVGPIPGMVLATKVRRGGSNELCLKNCGPLGYRASLVDYSGVAWKDTIRLRVLEVDHDAKEMVGEFLEKVASRG